MANISASIGIVTALPIECLAVRLLIDNLIDHPVPDDPNHYQAGTLASRIIGQPHGVVVALQSQDGTRNAAAICAHMARSFPCLRAFVMCGIAGGIPRLRHPATQVRLGDIVVATEGIVDYDHVRTVDGVNALRRQVDGMSKTLLRADHELHMKELADEEPWRQVLTAAIDRNHRFRRPAPESDPLYISPGLRDTSSGDRMRQPPAAPRVHRGAVGSADRLLRDASLRDTLAARYDICAVEMEASGIAVGADLHERHWFMVRGIADYGDPTKNDGWQPYAAMTAASYVSALLAECGPFGRAANTPGSAIGGMTTIVEALLSLQPMRDDYQRRAIFAQLPDRIRTAVPDSVTGRLHVVALVRTCEDFPDGMGALIEALRVTLGTDSPEFHRVEAVIRSQWSPAH